MECKENIFREDLDKFRKKRYKMDVLASQKAEQKNYVLLELEAYQFSITVVIIKGILKRGFLLRKV